MTKHNTTYRDIITNECTRLGHDEHTLFLGYNTRNGSRMYGTLSEVSPSKCIETPVAENLMAGLAIGLSLTGFKPVLCFERHDFILGALDQIVNHLDKIELMSDNEVELYVKIRAIVGDSSVLDVGLQHSQNYTAELRTMLKTILVVEPQSKEDFEFAFRYPGSIVIVEHRAQYDAPIE